LKISSCVTVHATQAMGTASTNSQTSCNSHWDESGGFMGGRFCKKGAGPILADLSRQGGHALPQSIASPWDPQDPRRDRDPREPDDHPKREEPVNDPDESPRDQPPVEDPDESPREDEPVRRDPDPQEPARQVHG
jgi:hypothetical protein